MRRIPFTTDHAILLMLRRLRHLMLTARKGTL